MWKKRKTKMGLAKLYLGSFSVFILGFLFIFVSPIFSGGSYSYPEASLNEYQTLNNNLTIALVKKEINPVDNLMRLDFSIEETSIDSSLSNVKYEVKSQYINGKEPLEVTINKVSDNYLTVIIKGIPKDFTVLSTTVSPRYIHPELQNSDDLAERDVKFYINENDKIINTKLAIASEMDYRKEYIRFQQDSLKEDISENEKEIETHKLSIKETKNQIIELETEMVYQTTEEKFQTSNNINGYKTSIQQHETEIELRNKNIEELNERINLLEEKRKSIK